MALPELDVQRVRRFAAGIWPEEFAAEVRMEVDVTARTVTLLECRPPWNPEWGEEWTRLPVARLRWTATRQEWSLYWSDRNSRFHEYGLAEPTRDVEVLLAHIEADPTCIFWG